MDNMQFTVLIMTMIGFFLTVIGLFTWNRTESRSDTRLILQLISSIEKEMKDFHGRLCRIESKKHQGR